MSFMLKWARMGLTTHPSQIRNPAAHAEACARAERDRRTRPRLKQAKASTLSNSITSRSDSAHAPITTFSSTSFQCTHNIGLLMSSSPSVCRQIANTPKRKGNFDAELKRQKLRIEQDRDRERLAILAEKGSRAYAAQDPTISTYPNSTGDLIGTAKSLCSSVAELTRLSWNHVPVAPDANTIVPYVTVSSGLSTIATTQAVLSHEQEDNSAADSSLANEVEPPTTSCNLHGCSFDERIQETHSERDDPITNDERESSTRAGSPHEADADSPSKISGGAIPEDFKQCNNTTQDKANEGTYFADSGYGPSPPDNPPRQQSDTDSSSVTSEELASEDCVKGREPTSKVSLVQDIIPPEGILPHIQACLADDLQAISTLTKEDRIQAIRTGISNVEKIISELSFDGRTSTLTSAWREVLPLKRGLSCLVLLNELLKPFMGEIYEKDTNDIVPELLSQYAALSSLEKPNTPNSPTTLQIHDSIRLLKLSNNSRRELLEGSRLSWTMFDSMAVNAELISFGDDRDEFIVGLRQLLTRLRKTLTFTDVSWQLEPASKMYHANIRPDHATPAMGVLKALIPSRKEYEAMTQSDDAENYNDGDSESDDVAIVIQPSANGEIPRRAKQFPEHKHSKHNEALAYRYVGTLSFPPVATYLEVFRYYNDKRLDTTFSTEVREYFLAEAEHFADRMKRLCIFASQRTLKQMRKIPGHDAHYLNKQEKLLCLGLREVRNFEKTVLHRPLLAGKFTACKNAKTGECDDEYCIYDHEFVKIECRDNMFPNMVCVTKGCHFKHSNPSWSPKNGGAPENLLEILCDKVPAGTKPKWKNCCMNFNRFGSCLWGDNCKFSHALAGVLCPEHTATGTCPRRECPLTHSKVNNNPSAQQANAGAKRHRDDSDESTSKSQPPAKRSTGKLPVSLGIASALAGSKRARDEPESSDEDSSEPERPTSRRRLEHTRLATAQTPTTSETYSPPAATAPQDPPSGQLLHSTASTTTNDSRDVDCEGFKIRGAGAHLMDIDHAGFRIKGAAGEDQMQIDPAEDATDQSPSKQQNPFSKKLTMIIDGHRIEVG